MIVVEFESLPKILLSLMNFRSKTTLQKKDYLIN